MVQAGIGLDTPRTNFGDATYLSHQPEFDISQELSFQSPSKDKNNLVEQLKNGRRGAIKTPRARAPLGDRRNFPALTNGGEFTPLLKSATRNSAMRIGKENGHVPATPAFLRPGGLDNINENTPLPHFGSSIYNESNNGYSSGTPAPLIESSSLADTPMAMPAKRNDGSDVLRDGNQLSLREQENMIDKIEKENFGLKLKTHFLEEALRKAGPGYSEQALKENTELKVDKVTMQKELMRYRKNLSNAEKDLEDYRRRLAELEQRSRQKHQSDDQREEINLLQHGLSEKEHEVEELRAKLDKSENDALQVEKLQDDIGDLEAELREKDRLLEDRDDEVETLRAQLDESVAAAAELEAQSKALKRREIELEEQAQSSEELEEARETIDDLEREIKRLKNELDEAKEEQQEAVTEKDRAVSDLEELQDEIANKSMTTKGLSRQIEEKANRLADELEDLKSAHTDLRKQYDVKELEIERLSTQLRSINQNGTSREDELRQHQDELKRKSDEKDLLQTRHDALTTESAGLQDDLKEARELIDDLEDKLEHEKTVALQSEREIRDEYKTELDRLNDTIEDLQHEIRDKERQLDDNNDQFDTHRRGLEAKLEQAEERANGLQRTLEKLQAAETSLHGKESRMQDALDSEQQRHRDAEATLKRQIDELNVDVEKRRVSLEEVRSELLRVKEELRISQREQKASAEKIEALEDEVEVLQTTLEEENELGKQDVGAAKLEAQNLREELQIKKLEIQRLRSAQDEPQESSMFRERLNSQLEDISAQLHKVRQEKQSLNQQLVEITIELASMKAATADLESERDEYKFQLEQSRANGEAAGRIDQEKIELRTAKLRLGSEARHAKEESKMLSDQLHATERELQEQVQRASEVEARLHGDVLDLKTKLSSAASGRGSLASRPSVEQLKQRIAELESQISANSPSRSGELSILRRDVASLRSKEADLLTREATQKETLRSLKRQVADLERKSHDLEMSQLHAASPNTSSASSSARRLELVETRNQLSAANQTLKEIRAQLKESEREAARKISALNLEMQANAATWDLEKDRLEAELDSALLSKEGLESQSSVLNQTITRLNSKISHLEKELQSARRSTNHDTTMAAERSELHTMLRETQIRASELEIELSEASKAIEKISAKEAEVRSQLKRVREERASHKERGNDAVRALRRVEADYASASQVWSEKKTVYKERAQTALSQLRKLESEFALSMQSWEEERSRLTKGVRFANQSLSENGAESPHNAHTALATAKAQHARELRGLILQIQWLQALVHREEGLRADAAFAKKYLNARIANYEACNKADLALLRRAGHATRVSENETPSVANGTKKASFKLVAHMVRAMIRMKNGAAEFREALKIREKVQDSLNELRRKRAEAAAREAMAKNTPISKSEIGEHDSAVIRMAERLCKESVKSPAKEKMAASGRHVASIEHVSSPQEMRLKMWGSGKGGDGWSGEAVLKKIKASAGGRRVSGLV